MHIMDDYSSDEVRPPRRGESNSNHRARDYHRQSDRSNRSAPTKRSKSLMSGDYNRGFVSTTATGDSRRTKQHRSRSHSVSSRSYNSRTSRSISTVDTASISTAGHSGSYHKRTSTHDSNGNSNSNNNPASSTNRSASAVNTSVSHNNATTFFDEPSRLLGFDSIIINDTPKRRNGNTKTKQKRNSTSTTTSTSSNPNTNSNTSSAAFDVTGDSARPGNRTTTSRSNSRTSTKRSSSQAPSSSARRGRSRSTNHRSRSLSHSHSHSHSHSRSKSRSHQQHPTISNISVIRSSDNSNSGSTNNDNRRRSSSQQPQCRQSSKTSVSSSRSKSSSTSSSSHQNRSRSRSQRRNSSLNSSSDGVGLTGSGMIGNGSGNGGVSSNISVGGCSSIIGGDHCSVTSSATLLPNEIEPNVHHNAIMTLEVQGPVIAEMKENELFARRAGINFTREGGDYLTLVHSGNDEETPLSRDEEHLFHGQVNRSCNNGQDNLFFDEAMINGNAAGEEFPPNATFVQFEDGINTRQLLGPDQDLGYLRDIAESLFVKWKGKTSPALARRLRDFQFAQEKRRKKFGDESPWGILGLYDHLAAVRGDIQWAEDAACRRANGEPYKAWFEFVEEQGTGKNRPFFTYIILALCTIFFVASIAFNGWRVEPFSINPMIGPSQETLVKMGAKHSLLIVEGKEVWRLLSAMVLHAGVIHYFLNMLALWFIGSAIEQCHGFYASCLLFVIPAIGGTLLSAVFLPQSITVGASSGIFGLIGACVADIYMNWALLFNGFVNKDNRHRYTMVLCVLFLDIIVNSLIGLTPLVDNFAHLGGMVFGFLCGTSTMQRVTTDMFGDQKKKTFWSTLKHNTLRLFGIILTVVTLCTSLALLMDGDGQTSPCPSCAALSCVSFPPWAAYENKWWYCDNYCGNVKANVTVAYTTSDHQDFYREMAIDCPSGDVATLYFDEDDLKTKAWVEGRLPKLCREHCPYVEL